jgi:glycosyltransferase involved in cell wall biosynthesis
MPARLSVIIATHERAPYLSRAIRSVKDQGEPGVQVIVVSDIADAATHAVASSLLTGDDLFVQRSGAPGPAVSRNLGIQLAAAEHVIFLDDDDSHAPGFLAQLLPQLNACPGAVLYCDAYLVREQRSADAVAMQQLGQLTFGEVSHDALAVKNQIPNNCLIFPRQLLRDCPFDESLVLLEDWDHLLNTLSKAPLHYLPLRGPVIHQIDPASGKTRNISNGDRLVETTLRIYAKWPAPSPAAQAARQAHFAAVGLALPAHGA